MVRFNIFIKSKKFRIDLNLLILIVILFLWFCTFICSKINSDLEKKANALFAYIAVGIFILGTARKLFMIAKPEKLHGKLEGFLEFRNDAILIGENKIELSAVKELFIVNDDYYMMPNGNGKGFTSSLSNGVQNELSLKLNDGTKITTSFQLFNEYDMGKIQNILTHYYLSGKMTFENLAKVLKLSRSETSQMKNYFQNSHIL